MSKKEHIIVGDIVITHGLQGEVKVLSDSDFKDERFIKGQQFYIVNEAKNIVDYVTLRTYRVHKNFDLLTFEDKQSISDVEHYKGLFLAIDISNVRKLTVSEGYYYTDIISNAVYNEQGDFIGHIYKISETPAYDLWYVKREGKTDLIVPFNDHFVRSVDILHKKVVIHLIEGMD